MCWLTRLIIVVQVLGLLPGGASIAAEVIDAKILFCGDLSSDRAKDYASFLESHFSRVVVRDLLTFKEDQAQDFDLVIFDWSSMFNADGEAIVEKMQAFKPPQLSTAFTRPAILVAEGGGTVVKKLKLKINWLCLCLNGPAYRLAVEHPIFHTPLEVNPEFSEQATPEDYPDLTIEPSLGAKMKVWHLQDKELGDIDPGLVSTLYGFADSPDAEVFAQGCAMKGPDTVALGRHANYFLWGFSAPPSQMAPAAQRLFVNAVCYMRKFDGQSPLVQRTASGREWGLRYALIPRSFSEASMKRTELEMRKILPRFMSVLPENFRKDPEAFIADRLKKDEEATHAYMEEVIPKPLFEQCGMDVDKYLAYYGENLEYLRPDEEKPERFLVDEDAKTVGPSNRSVQMLERCIAMLERGDRPELATRLLKRYTSEDFATAADWRTWLAANQPRLYFSDAGGYKFFVQPAALPVQAAQ